MENMENRQLDAAESLALINRMIDNTRNRIARNSGLPFIIWGYTTVAVTAAVTAAVMATGDTNWNLLWFALPLIGTLLMWITHRRPATTEGYARSFVDRVVGYVWLVMGLSAFFVSMLGMFAAHIDILFFILLLMGIGTTLTCLIIRFTPGIAGGVIGIALSPLLLFFGGIWTGVIFAAGFVVMMVIPGHILNYKSHRPCSRN